MERTAAVSRRTKETDITLTLSLDGGETAVETGIGFFDHMLTALALHGGLGLRLQVRGDLEVDGHHTVEDTGLVLGQALRQALGAGAGIERFGQARVPMDEALAAVALDIGGRPYLRCRIPETQARIGAYDACLTEEFWRAVCAAAGLTLHIEAYGENAHHIAEAVFKACAHALRRAVRPTGGGVLSTKGVL
ncbi:MAG: imidazoleglycerol-phosphate dehydratase HisB [Oscillospiraceae bacterium]|jgi:imidazoleglycerol-phosphate dehydratase|nr:imidazoleglycerol-phosphate dehydratase HisB [Oscillospiraceae bacterium]